MRTLRVGHGFGERAGGERADAEPALHVEHARPEQLAVRFVERHARQLPDGPDRVEVTDEQHARPGAGPGREHVIGRRAGGEARDRCAGRREPSGEKRAARVERAAIGAR